MTALIDCFKSNFHFLAWKAITCKGKGSIPLNLLSNHTLQVRATVPIKIDLLKSDNDNL